MLDFSKQGIKSSEQLFAMDKTRVISGFDKITVKNKREMSEAGRKLTSSRFGFNYQHRISLFAFVCVDGTKLPPAGVFRGVLEPSLSAGV